MCCLHKRGRIESIKRRQAFKKVYSRGKHAADSLFVVYALANETESNRLGITVSKKVGNAVTRNRIKRWLKESYLTLSLKQGYDFVILARAASGQLLREGAFVKVTNSITHSLKRLGIIL